MEKYRNLTLIAIALSLVLHVMFGLGLHFSPSFESSEEVDEIELIVLDPSQFETKGQIVDQSEKAINNEIDKNAKYLSRHNQRVVKQTRAAHSGRFQNNAGQGIAPKAASQAQPDQAKTEKALTALNGLPTIQDLKPKFNWDKVEEKTQKVGVARPGPKSQSSDYLKDLEVGQQTVLSTKEFMYFTYYSRIKSKIQQYWEPSIKEKVHKLFRQGRKIASVERKTRLLIVLDEQGKLVGVKVLGESGIHDLDDAAVEAFKDAAPFPNPPSGLLEKDKTVKIRWDFILEA